MSLYFEGRATDRPTPTPHDVSSLFDRFIEWVRSWRAR